jgi:[ribosomal protein S5]-alanine N-acetyltransferase
MARTQMVQPFEMVGRRVTLRTLCEADYDAWHQVRNSCRDWLVKWEPRPAGAPYMAEDKRSFLARCTVRGKELQMGTGYGFGIFLDDRLVGEITLSSIQRGPFQSGFVGYWIDQQVAGHGLVPEAVVMVLHFAFEALILHRIEVAIIPRNRSSCRVVEKLGLRMEGIAVRFLEIDGKWEDHARYAMTNEEWSTRRQELLWYWLGRT